MKKNRSLLNIFAYPEIQSKLLLPVILTGIMTGIIFGAFIYMQTSLLLQLTENTQQQKVIQSTLIEYGIVSGVCYLLTMILMLLLILLISHRLIGPLKRLMRETEQMYDDKNPHRFILRDNDHLKPFFDKLNRIMDNTHWKKKNTEEND